MRRRWVWRLGTMDRRAGNGNPTFGTRARRDAVCQGCSHEQVCGLVERLADRQRRVCDAES